MKSKHAFIRCGFAVLLLSSPQLFAVNPAFQDAVVRAQPLLYYQLNEARGEATNRGTLGPAFNGVYNGAIVRNVSSFSGDSGVTFKDGTAFLESKAVVPAALTGNPTFTVEVIVRIPGDASVNAYPPFLHWGSAETGKGLFFGLQSGSPDRVYAGFFGAGLVTSARMSVDGWYHVVMVRSGGGDSATGTTVYVDGVSMPLIQDLGRIIPSLTASTFRINRAADATRFFTGSIDEIVLYDRALEPAEITEHFQAFVGLPPAQTPYQLAVSNAQPILYYQFNEPFGDAVNHGMLGTGFNGKFNGPITRRVQTFSGDWGVTFRDDTALIESGAPVPAALTGNPTFTVEAIVRVPRNATVSNYAPFLHWGSTQTGQGLFFGLEAGNRDAVYAGFYGSGLFTSQTTPVDAWYHVVMVRQGGGDSFTGTTVYVDGASVALSQVPSGSPATPALTSTPFRVNQAADTGRFFTGSIDELALYDRALGTNEIAQHFRAFVGPLPPPTPYQLAVSNAQPILHYWFNEAAGETVNHGTLGSEFNGKNNGAISRRIPTLSGDGGITFNDATGFVESRATVPAALTGNPTFSVEAVVRVPANATVNSHPPFLHWGSAETSKGMFFGLRGNTRDMVYAGFYNTGLFTSETLPLDAWYHVIMVRRSGGDSLTGTTVFIDGNSVPLGEDFGGARLTPSLTSSPFRINRAADLTRLFTGSLDELAVYDRALDTNEIAQHFKVLVGPPLPPTPFQLAVSNAQPLLHYRLNELTAYALNYGTLGPAFNGRYNGAIARRSDTLNGDGGVTFADAADFIESRAAAPAVLVGNPTFTVETVVRIPAGASVNLYPPFLHWGSGGSGQEMYFALQGNNPDVVYAGFHSGGLKTATRFPIDSWMHIAMVRHGGEDSSTGTAVYLNGLSTFLTDDISRLMPQLTSTEFRINRARDNTRFFTGTMDEIALYDRALDSSEILQHYRTLGTTSYAAWARQQFDTNAPNFATIAQPDADPDGDKTVNVMEYLSGTNPNDQGSTPTGLKGKLINVNNRFFPSAIYRKRLNAPDVVITLEISQDLRSWTSDPGPFELLVGFVDDDSTIAEVAQLTTKDLSEFVGAKTVYLRQRVSLAP